MHSTFSPAMRSVRRRNALIPLPLLPPVPRNTIVTSVRIVHNSDTVDSDGTQKPNLFFNSAPHSPSQTSLCFPPGAASKRPRIGRRRSSCTPCDDASSLLNPNRKPRSTIVVTVRLANESASFSPDATSQRPSLAPAPRRAANVANVTAAAAAMLARKQANKPRVSSPLATCVVVSASGSNLDGGISPLSRSVSSSPLYPSVNARPYTRKPKQSASKKASKAKNGGRVGMLRWAVLNNSGPEVGRRILSTGVRLAKEIWEAERVVEEVMEMENGSPVQEQEREQGVEQQEEMDVDSEDVEMEAPAASTQVETTTETTRLSESKNTNMEVDVPTAPVAAFVALPAVVPAPAWPLQVQVQFEIAVQVFSRAKKTQKELEKQPKRWFERIAL